METETRLRQITADKFRAIGANQAARQKNLKSSYDYIDVDSGAAGWMAQNGAGYAVDTTSARAKMEHTKPSDIPLDVQAQWAEEGRNNVLS